MDNKVKISLFSAVLLGVSSIIGSGWLFAPFKSAVIAGPAAIYSWIIGAVLVILLSFCFAEIASVYPKRGLSAIIPTLSHNKFFGFPFALANWLGIVAVIGLEADATVQYLINLMPSLQDKLFLNAQLTWWGNSLSIVLIIMYGMVNYWGVRVLAKTNNIMTIVKVIIPVVTGLIIISFAFHVKNFTYQQHSFMPFGFKSVLMAVVSSGIIVAFNGFQTVVSFASEIREPNKTIPKALFLGISICLLVYLLLQVAFIGSMPANMLTSGWQKITMHAPMVQLSLMLGLGMLTSIIYFGAMLGPTGAAIAFTGSATRMFTAMSHREQMPRYFGNIHGQYNVSRRSLLMNTALSILFVMLFRSWSQLAQVLSMFHIISYVPIPVALVVFRRRLERSRYLFYLPAGTWVALFLFIVFTYLLTLMNPKIFMELALFFAIALSAFILLNAKTLQGVLIAVYKSRAFIVYIIGLIVLCKISPMNSHLLTQLEYLPIFIAFSLATFYLMTRLDSNTKMPLKRKWSQRARISLPLPPVQ